MNIIQITLTEKHFPGFIIDDFQTLQLNERTDISQLIAPDINYLSKLEYDQDPQRPISSSLPLTSGLFENLATYHISRSPTSQRKIDLYTLCKQIENKLNEETNNYEK